MRLGMFCIDSGEAIATDKLKDLQMLKDKESLAVSEGISKVYGVSNVQKGVWIAGENILLSFSSAEVHLRNTKGADMCLQFVDNHFCCPRPLHASELQSMNVEWINKWTNLDSDCPVEL